MGRVNSGIIRSVDFNDTIMFINAPGMKRSYAPVSFNSGTIPVAEGAAGPGDITATLTNMSSGYGYRRDYPGFITGDNADYIATNYAPTINNSAKLWFRIPIFYNPSANWEVLCGARDGASDYWFFAIDSDNPGQLVLTFVKGGVVRKAHSSNTVAAGYNVLGGWLDEGEIGLSINGVEVSYGTQDTYDHGDLGVVAPMRILEYGAAIYRFRGIFYSMLLQAHGPTDAEIAADAIIKPDFGLMLDSDGKAINPVATTPEKITTTTHQSNSSDRFIELTYRTQYDHAESRQFVPLTEARLPDDLWQYFSQDDLSDLVITTVDGEECPRYLVPGQCSKVNKTLKAIVRVPATGEGVNLALQVGGPSKANGNPCEGLGDGSYNARRAYEFLGGAARDIMGLASITEYNSPTFPTGGPLGTYLHLESVSSQAIRDADADDLSFGDGSTDEPFSVFGVVKMANADEFNMFGKYLASPGREYFMQSNSSELFLMRIWDDSLGVGPGRRWNTAVTDFERLNLTQVYTYNGDETDPLSGQMLYWKGERVDDTDLTGVGYVAMENLSNHAAIGERNNAIYSDGDFHIVVLLPSELSAGESRMLNDAWEGAYFNEDNAAWSIAQVVSPLPLNGPRDEGDVFIFQTTDNGDIEITNGLVTMTPGLGNAVYLSLFGGNEDDPGGEDKTLSWWGNSIEGIPSRQYRSETQYLLRAIPATSFNLRRIEDAVKRDLAWMLLDRAVSSLDVAVALTGVNRITITININGNETLVYTINWQASI